MITIIGDNPDELADLQDVIERGILNTKRNDEITLDVSYKLSSGDQLLVNKYNHIIGSIEKENKDFPQAKDIEPCVESFKELMDELPFDDLK